MLKLLLAVCILSGLMTAGCSTSYYRVTDPGSGKTYYTSNLEKAVQGGAVKFEDTQSGSYVTLQSSEVKELSEGEFIAVLAANQTPKPTLETDFSRGSQLSPEMSDRQET
jgi:hypothetical protein